MRLRGSALPCRFELRSEVAEFGPTEDLANIRKELRLLLVDVVIDDLSQHCHLGDVPLRGRFHSLEFLEQHLDHVVLLQRFEHHRVSLVA